MEKKTAGDGRSREDYRHLPPRVTAEEMVATQAVVHPVDPVRVGTEDEWAIRHGWTG